MDDSANAIGSDSLRYAVLFQEHMQLLFSIDSLELVTLRAHAFVEVALFDLLVVRLGAPKSKLPDLNFSRLISLALAGASAELITLVTDLNRLRNYVAHDLTAKDLDHRVLEFVKRHENHLTQRWAANTDDVMRRFVWLVIIAASTIAGVAKTLVNERRERHASKIGLQAYDEPSFVRACSENFLQIFMTTTRAQNYLFTEATKTSSQRVRRVKRRRKTRSGA